MSDPLDGKSDEEVLEHLGPAWSVMTSQQRAAYGPRLQDPYFTALAAFASGTDLQRQLVRETYEVFDQIEAQLAALELQYAYQCAYRAAVARLVQWLARRQPGRGRLRRDRGRILLRRGVTPCAGAAPRDAASRTDRRPYCSAIAPR